MRIFGGDRIKSLMTALNVPEDEPIQAGMISGAIESAQEKIEGFNFDARRHLLEYDDVMNKHREIIYKKRREMLENFEFEISDFEKLEFKAEDFEKKKKELGEENFNQAARFVSLKVLDNLWQEHLSNMDHMRDSVRLRAYGGHDPLIEYKNEGRRLFQQLLEQMDFETADNILKASAQVQSAPRNNMIVNIGLQGKEVGRNDFCPCGSGKKFKKCGMLNTEEHKKLISQK
ncbi:MAG: hypothetical protein A3I87_02120 [Candidatus Staskawiczbacteria bacterium RIFCSPLOWO2_02_FULL_39_8]|nr:MAG: hypothetical protein A3I87_02120 [Candidatus Staskawiczbacteria bacterium RIFCSPLOWO2_02_FULL_39_8]